MMKNNADLTDLPAMPLGSVALALLGAAGGALAAVMLLPNLGGTLFGAQPKAYWYLSRSSAIVAYLLTWLSVVLGLAITNRMARAWPGGPAAFDLHQHASLLGLAFGLFHALVLLGDRYINYSLFQVLVPFASTNYRPAPVGIGQLGFYLLAVVGLSFYARKFIGQRTWRLIHYFSLAAFLLALFHGAGSGTDSTSAWATLMYWSTGASVLFLSVYRVLVARPALAPELQGKN